MRSSHRLGLATRPLATPKTGGALWAGCIGGEGPQTFAGTDCGHGLLISDSARVGMPAHPEVLVGTASVLVAYIAFTHIAGQDEDFFGRTHPPCLTPGHRFPQSRSVEESLQAGVQPEATSIESNVSVATLPAAATATVVTAAAAAAIATAATAATT
jgi:hypothetical protein